MKKNLVGPILTIIAFALLTAIFVYFFVSLNRLEKKTVEISNATAANSGQVSAIVNFFNSNLNASQQ